MARVLSKMLQVPFFHLPPFFSKPPILALKPVFTHLERTRSKCLAGSFSSTFAIICQFGRVRALVDVGRSSVYFSVLA